MRIITQNDQRLEWISLTWIQFFATGALAVVPLFFVLIALVEGELVAALLPVAVSLLGITLFAFFAGKRRVTFDKGTGEITVAFRSLLRHRIEERDLDQLSGILLFAEFGEDQSEIVDPSDRRIRKARYRAVAKFRNGPELALSGEANMLGDEAHRVAQSVQDWLGDK